MVTVLSEQEITLSEYHIYGSSRLGVKSYPDTLIFSSYDKDATPGALPLGISKKTPWYSWSHDNWVDAGKLYAYVGNTSYMFRGKDYRLSRFLGLKHYELTDHLGNVNVAVLDKISGTGTGNSGEYAYLSANISSFNDYYPFGMPMPERNGSLDKYRFGFNEQERTDEVYGKGNLNTALFWEYDTRLGRRWNLDPVKAAWESPYVISRNNPISLNDPDGDCSTCPPSSVSGSVTARVNIGGTSDASGSIGFGIGVTGQTGRNFALGGGASGSLNFGGLGTSSLTPGLRFDFSLTLTGTVGGGVMGAQSLQTINSQMPSGIMNTFKHSGTLGVNLILGSDNRNQGTGYIGFRMGDFSVGHSNDFFLGLTDHYWGAETHAKIGSEGGLNVAIWNEIYNGKRVVKGNNATGSEKADYKANDLTGKSYEVMLVKQNARDISLNSARTQVMVNYPTKTGGTLTLGVGGEGGLHMAPQRWLHFMRRYDQFKHNKTATKPIVIIGGKAFLNFN